MKPNFTILLFLIPLFCFSQITPEQELRIESLKKIIHESVKDTTTFNAQLEWAKLVHHSDFELAIELAEKVKNRCNDVLNNKETLISKAHKKDYLNYLAQSLSSLAATYLQHGEIDKAIKLNLQIFQIFQELEDKKKHADKLENLGNIYFDSGNIDTSLIYYEQSLKLSEEVGDKKGVAGVLNSLGNAHSVLSEHELSISYYQRGLKLSQDIGYKRGIDLNSHNIGSYYDMKGNYSKAIEYYRISWKICEELGEKHGTSISLYTIGDVYFNLKEYDKALDFYLQGQKISNELNDPQGIAISWESFGYVHSEKGDYQMALEYHNKSLEIATKHSLKAFIASNLQYIGEIHIKLNNLDTALVFFEKSLLIKKEMHDKPGIASSLISIGKVQHQKGNTRTALQMSQEAYTLAKNIEEINVIKDAAQLLYINHKKAGNHQNALEMHEVFIDTRDAIESEANQKAIIKLEYQNAYETKLVTDSIKNIQEQQLIQTQISAQKQKFNLVRGGLFLSALLSGLMIYFYFQSRKANQVMKKQSIVIEQTNQDLSVSLNHQMALQGEIHHRVKNNLQIILSLLELQKVDIDDKQAQKSIEAISSRIYSMSAIHDILYKNKGAIKIKLLDYVENLCQHFGNFSNKGQRPTFNINIGDQTFDMETSVPLGIIITELITNSLKYAQVKKQQLQIDINMEEQTDHFCIVYKDNGPGFINNEFQKKEGGLGKFLLQSMAKQLNGSIETKNDQGAASTIYFKKGI